MNTRLARSALADQGTESTRSFSRGKSVQQCDLDGVPNPNTELSTFISISGNYVCMFWPRAIDKVRKAGLQSRHHPLIPTLQARNFGASRKHQTLHSGPILVKLPSAQQAWYGHSEPVLHVSPKSTATRWMVRPWARLAHES
jgi:hypothetical protein